MNIHLISMDTTYGGISSLQTHQALRKVRNRRYLPLKVSPAHQKDKGSQALHSPSLVSCYQLIGVFSLTNSAKKRTKRRNHWQNVWQKTAEESLKEAAIAKNDEILWKIKGMHLVTREAHDHPSCQKDFTQVDVRHQTAKNMIIPCICKPFTKLLLNLLQNISRIASLTSATWNPCQC